LLFLVDENLPAEVADQLRGAGHDATTVFERRLVGQIDVAVAAVCRTERRALLTLDLDFANTLLYRRMTTSDWWSCVSSVRTSHTYWR
jgi:predicted nuclease of predicted toxin-antitoxin system